MYEIVYYVQFMFNLFCTEETRCYSILRFIGCIALLLAIPLYMLDLYDILYPESSKKFTEWLEKSNNKLKSL